MIFHSLIGCCTAYGSGYIHLFLSHYCVLPSLSSISPNPETDHLVAKIWKEFKYKNLSFFWELKCSIFLLNLFYVFLQIINFSMFSVVGNLRLPGSLIPGQNPNSIWFWLRSPKPCPKLSKTITKNLIKFNNNICFFYTFVVASQLHPQAPFSPPKYPTDSATVPVSLQLNDHLALMHSHNS